MFPVVHLVIYFVELDYLDPQTIGLFHLWVYPTTRQCLAYRFSSGSGDVWLCNGFRTSIRCGSNLDDKPISGLEATGAASGDETYMYTDASDYGLQSRVGNHIVVPASFEGTR